MKLRLRYVFVFLLGMACMYWMVRTGALVVDPMYRGSLVAAPVVESVVNIWTVASGDVMDGDVLSGAVVDSWALQSGEPVSSETTALDDTVAIIQWTWSEIPTDTSSASDTKDVACAKPDGNYETPLVVWWNDVLTATTTSYAKRGLFLHYVVFVSNGEKYYFYHNCSNGIATNAQNVTSTAINRVVLSNGQVYLR